MGASRNSTSIFTQDEDWERQGIVPASRDLARNEEFSEIAVINIYFSSSQQQQKLSVGGTAGEISR